MVPDLDHVILSLEWKEATRDRLETALNEFHGRQFLWLSRDRQKEPVQAQAIEKDAKFGACDLRSELQPTGNRPTRTAIQASAI